MSYLDSLEQEFVLESTRLFKEYDKSNFIANAKYAITKKAQEVDMSYKFLNSSNMINKAIKNFSAISVNKSEIKAFVAKCDLSVLAKSELYMRPIITDTAIFRPQYLNQYVMMVQGVIDKVLNGNIKDDEAIKFMSNQIADTVKKQVVKCKNDATNPYDILKKKETNNVVRVSVDYIKSTVLPYVIKMEETKQRTIAEATSVLHAISETETTVIAMLKTLNRIRKESNLESSKLEKLNQVSYNAIRGIIDVITYISMMTIRNINIVSTNFVSCDRVFNDIYNIASGSNINENAFNTSIIPVDTDNLTSEMTKGRADAFVLLSKNIYEFHAGLPSAKMIDNQVIDMGVGKEGFKSSIYDEIGKAYVSIGVGLDVIAGSTDEYLMLFDDIIKKSGFQLELEMRFKNEITAITDVSDYNSAINTADQSKHVDPDVYAKIISEVRSFGKNMETIAKIVEEDYKRIKMLSARFASNVNGEYTDIETVNQLKVFLKDFNEQFNQLTRLVAKGFYDRLKALGNLLSIAENNMDPMEPDNSPIIDMNDSSISLECAFDSIYSNMVESMRNEFKALEASYYIEKELALKGINVILEKDDADANNSTDNTENDDMEVQPPEDGTDAGAEDNTEDNNEDTTQPSGDYSSFIQSITDKFMEFTNKSVKKNTKWLEENKEELSNRSYSNVTITILPYKNIPAERFVEDIGKLTEAVRSLTKDNISSLGSKNDLYNKIFAFIENGITEENGVIGDQIISYYKAGTDEVKVIPVSNSELKTEVTETYIPFCEDFTSEDSFRANLVNALVELGQAADEIAGEYDDSVTEQAEWLSEALKQFANGICIAAKDRNQDYLKVLSSLLPKTPTAPKKPEKNKDTKKDEEEQPAEPDESNTEDNAEEVEDNADNNSNNE